MCYPGRRPQRGEGKEVLSAVCAMGPELQSPVVVGDLRAVLEAGDEAQLQKPGEGSETP